MRLVVFVGFVLLFIVLEGIVVVFCMVVVKFFDLEKIVFSSSFWVE